jgi:hypothetical protein
MTHVRGHRCGDDARAQAADRPADAVSRTMTPARTCAIGDLTRIHDTEDTS